MWESLEMRRPTDWQRKEQLDILMRVVCWQPLKLDVKRKLSARSDRVKCVDLHPTEPWMLASLYSGHVHVWNYESQNAPKETASLNLEATTYDPELLKRVITEDKTWIYGFDSETTQQASEWRFKNELRPKKARKAPSKVKVMLTVFFDYQGIVHHEFQQQGSTITADSYLGVLRGLREAIRQKRPELWRSKSWILSHDNAPAHTALKISKFLQDHSTSVFPQPLYSPDLAPCDFFLFGKQLVKTFEVCEQPVRAAKFVARKNWVITGSDDMQVRVFNYNTLERSHTFEAHSDYIRSIVVHPTQPYVLTSSDDMVIKLWNWEKQWTCSQVFEGHSHYVMQIVINPKDNNTFASASLDRTLKVWQLGSTSPNFTLEGHEKGVNCVDYYHGGDKPYLISGADDRLVKIWDYQNKTCVQTLEGHAQNISAVIFHPELPIIMTGSEDGTVRIWHANTYRLESSLNYGLERVWTVACLRGGNTVVAGYDEGSVVLQLGREQPAVSMDAGGKIVWARHAELQQANLKALLDSGPELRDGERLPLPVKDMGSCEIYPQTISHNPNGRFVVVCGDGEYIIYTAMALRNKSFGTAQEFVWAFDSSEYAVRENSTTIKIFKNFKEKKTCKPEFGAEAIFGGFMLGVRSVSGLTFYDWETLDLIRRIEIQPKHVLWSENGELVSIATEDTFYILRYNPTAVQQAKENKEAISEDGVEEAFTVLGEVGESVRTGIWVGDCFIYTNGVNRLNYYVGGEIVTVAHLDRTLYLLGYRDNRLFLGDKELGVVSYGLLQSVLAYQTAVMRGDFETADSILPVVPRDQRTRVAHFLEKQGFKKQALAVSTDPDHRFELSLQLGELETAQSLAREAQSEMKWRQLGELALARCNFSLAQESLERAGDYGGLLLLASAMGSGELMDRYATMARQAGMLNVAFLALFVRGRTEEALQVLIDSNRLPEAAFFARTFLPSQISRVVKLWKETLAQTNEKAAQALADPAEYENLFPGLDMMVMAENHFKGQKPIPAAAYPRVADRQDETLLEKYKNLPDSVIGQQFTQCCMWQMMDNGRDPEAAALERELELDMNNLDLEEDNLQARVDLRNIVPYLPASVRLGSVSKFNPRDFIFAHRPGLLKYQLL
ncbi:COPB2 [Cordylochernes scorpioides]|uniref:Beta'-coat protein n=1 Tax=Cordylochernes scorpioides TaxID=51811 RepID=A0ABY6LHS0_9ARAC|nr:COPB2 [Cordylochernes scorpioides]